MENSCKEIVKVGFAGNYKIHFRFSDGTERTVDFEPFLRKAKNPATHKYLDKEHFRQFELEYGDIQWNDYEMCFPIWDIYEGNI